MVNYMTSWNQLKDVFDRNKKNSKQFKFITKNDFE
jgi:hypothetical protein